MEFIDTQKHRRKLIRNGYMYVYNKPLANGNTSWECVQRRGSKRFPGSCRALLKLDVMDRFVEATNEHSHSPSNRQCEVSTVKSAIKRRSETTNETTQQILGGELAGIYAAASANLPALHHIRRTI